MAPMMALQMLMSLSSAAHFGSTADGVELGIADDSNDGSVLGALLGSVNGLPLDGADGSDGGTADGIEPGFAAGATRQNSTLVCCSSSYTDRRTLDLHMEYWPQLEANRTNALTWSYAAAGCADLVTDFFGVAASVVQGVWWVAGCTGCGSPLCIISCWRLRLPSIFSSFLPGASFNTLIHPANLAPFI